MEQLVKEAQSLAEQGVKELILVAQETTLYGKDLYGKKSLHVLLKELCKIKGIRWIRILYCYPEEIYDELIQTIKEEPKVCHYLDLPIQHASDRILKRMGRRTSKQQLIDTITKLRKEIPDIALRTTLITGFPGETQEQHEEVMEFVDEMEFDRLGVFTFSPQEGTPAFDMEDQVDEDIKTRRSEVIMQDQYSIMEEKNNEKIGKTYKVVVEDYDGYSDSYTGRTYMDAPEIDGLVKFTSHKDLDIGDFVDVEIFDVEDYDLIGEVTA